MPAPVLAGFINFLQPILQESYPDLEIWIGEVPRFNSEQEPITIEGNFPAFRFVMDESGLDREWTTEDPYGDEGSIEFQCWGVSLTDVMNVLNIAEAQLCNTTNWDSIDLPGGPLSNPYQVYKCLFRNWWYGQIEGVRAQDSSLIFMGRISFSIGIHGAIQSR